MGKKLYGSVNNQATTVKKLYGSVNGDATGVTKLYGSVSGQTKLVQQSFGHVEYAPTDYGRVVYYTGIELGYGAGPNSYNVDVMGDLLDELENNGMFF